MIPQADGSTPHAPAPRAAPARRPLVPLRSALTVIALALSLTAALLPGAFLGACAPGTSTDAGNPELTIAFRKGGQPVDFRGHMRIYASDSNPAFYAPSPNTGRPDLDIDIELEVEWHDCYGNVHVSKNASPVKRINRHCLDRGAGYRVALPLLPSHLQSGFSGGIAVQRGPKGLSTHRPFNLLVDHADSATALVRGIAINALRTGYLDADHRPIDTLWVDLERGVGITGTIDTAGLPDRPLILFLPGSPLSAPVQGNRFHLAGAPRIKLPVRMVTRSGLVYAFRDSLDGTRSDAFYAADSVLALVPGDRLDSIDLPDTLPFPGRPVAHPAGVARFTDTLLVTLTAEPGATIYYTTDGNDPELHSTRYEKPVVLRATAVLKAVAYRQGQNFSPVSANTYIQEPPPPKASPGSLAFRDSVTVTLTTPAMEGVILYTLDGSSPNDSSRVYDRPLVFKATTTLKAVTFKKGMGLSQPIEQNYILIPDTLAQP